MGKKRRRHPLEQIIKKLRDADAMLAVHEFGGDKVAQGAIVEIFSSGPHRRPTIRVWRDEGLGPIQGELKELLL